EKNGHGADAYFGDESDILNPPWEQDSGQFPIASASQLTSAQEAELEDRRLEPLLEQSMAGISLGGYSETGKGTALPPLRTGGSWSRGIRAPRPGTDGPAGRAVDSRSAGIEVDAQPSMQMAALRSSTLLKATTIISAALLISRIFGLLRTTLF